MLFRCLDNPIIQFLSRSPAKDLRYPCQQFGLWRKGFVACAFENWAKESADSGMDVGKSGAFDSNR